MNKKMSTRWLLAASAAMVAVVSFAQEPAAPAKSADGKSAAVQTDSQAKGKYKPLAEARAKIGDIIADPAKMVEVMKTLSPEDQKTFTADVNAAISNLPGSVEDKTAKYLNVNRAALKGAEKGNMANVLAVTFASVPPESLTVISERYANDLFNRDADPSQRMNDAAYEKIAKDVVGRVETATAGSDDAGVRNTLAILMFLRADTGKIEGLSDRLVETMPDATTRELAKTEWIPAAMANGEEKSYESMLAYADAGKAPNIDVVIVLAGPQILDAALVDITSGLDNKQGQQTTPQLDQAFGGFDEARVNAAELEDTQSLMSTMHGGAGAIPRTTDPNAPWNPENKRGDKSLPKPYEPTPYPFSGM